MGGVEVLQLRLEQWIVLVPRVDKYVQAVRCHTMTKVKADFPMYCVNKNKNNNKNKPGLSCAKLRLKFA